MPSTSAQFAHAPQKNNWYFAGIITFLLFLVFGAVGVVIFQSTLEKPQDVQPQAMVADGKVELSFSPASSTQLQPNQQHTIDFKINTHGYQADKIELFFNLSGPGFSSAPEFIVTSTALQTQVQEVQQTSDGYLVSLKATVASTSAFSTVDPTNFAQLKFTPSQAGQINLNFDVEDSIVTLRNVTPAEDELKTITSAMYTVQAVGGTTSKQCNESCSSNSECAPNSRCYDTGSNDGKRCRLVTNVTSTSCAGPADDGLQRTCNEYCADARECASGYTCHFNRCRHPQNVENVSCAVPTVSQQQAIAQSCNRSCGSNRDCAANMRCFYGACRLASNPSSSSCSVATKPTVSATYETKGGTTTGTGTSTATKSATATASGQTSTTSGTIFKASPKPSTSMAPQPPTDPTEEDSSLLDTLMSPLVKTALLALGGLILLLLILWLLSKMMGRNRRSPQSVVAQPHDQEYEKELQAKIEALKQTPVSPQPATPVVQPAPVQPVAPQPQVSRPQPVVPVSRPVVTPTKPVVQPTPLVERSSMMERIRNKGITPPNSDTPSDTP